MHTVMMLCPSKPMTCVVTSGCTKSCLRVRMAWAVIGSAVTSRLRPAVTMTKDNPRRSWVALLSCHSQPQRVMSNARRACSGRTLRRTGFSGSERKPKSICFVFIVSSGLQSMADRMGPPRSDSPHQGHMGQPQSSIPSAEPPGSCGRDSITGSVPRGLRDQAKQQRGVPSC